MPVMADLSPHITLYSPYDTFEKFLYSDSPMAAIDGEECR